MELDILRGLTAGKHFFGGLLHFSKLLLQVMMVFSIFVFWILIGITTPQFLDISIVVLKLLQLLVSTFLISLFFYISTNIFYDIFYKKKFSLLEGAIKSGRDTKKRKRSSKKR